MPSKITDKPPKKVQKELNILKVELDKVIPAKKLDHNIIVGSWNIRAFGDLTEKWTVTEKDKPKRNLHALLLIGEIISRFDVVALQEVKGNIKCLRHLMKLLGPNWGLILTDVTKGSAGNGERMAYLYDTRKVKLSGLACELVVPTDKRGISADAFDKQFARTPYAVGFQSCNHTFILITLHVIFGHGKKGVEKRKEELKAIARWLSDWAKDINAWDHNLIVLGDFNIDRKGDPLYDAFTSTGLHTPEELDLVPRTLSSKPDKPDTNKFYDQIAWFNGSGGVPVLSMKYSNAGGFDFKKHIMTSLNNNDLSWRISDHYPLWCEFLVGD